MITRVKGSYVIGYNGADHEIIRDGEVVYENDTIIYVGKHYEGEVSKTEDAGNAVHNQLCVRIKGFEGLLLCCHHLMSALLKILL